MTDPFFWLPGWPQPGGQTIPPPTPAPAKVVCFTINGYMGDMWQGPQADVGRYLEGQGLVKWQPVGYNSGAFPLSTGVADGLREIKRLIRDVYPGWDFVIVSWSEGSIIYCELLEAMRRGDMADVFSHCKGAVTYGNPYREAGSWGPMSGVGAVPDPGGAGIGGPRYNTRNTPVWQVDYANPGDIYAVCDTGPSGNDMRLIFDFVLTKWSGLPLDLWTEAQEWITRPDVATGAMFKAVIDAIAFYIGGQRPHQNYDTHAGMNFLAGIITTTIGSTMSTPTISPSKAKTWTALIGSILVAVIPLILTVSTHLPEPWPAIVGGFVALLTALGVYHAPYNKV